MLDAAESAVNACRRVGFGVQMSASNYGKANAASTVGGGESPVPVPTEPPCFGGLTMPPPMGGGVAAPLGWSLVEQFVGEVWPDGNPAQMHAAAAAWRGFAAAIGAAAGPMSASGTALGGMQIPESGKMVEAAGKVASGLSDIAAQAQALASNVDAFADNVQATQDAVRDLLHQLSPGGVLETIGGIFTGHNPMDKIKQVAGEIKTVLNNMKRQADASSQLFSQGINALDSATDSLESWAKKEFISAFGQDVGNVLSSDFNALVDLPEGGLKFVAQTAHGLDQLDPTRFAYDPQGALDTWKGLANTAETLTNPVHLASEIISDPQGSLNTVKGLVDWEDVEKGHPFRALGYDAAQVGSFFIPGAGEAAPAIDGASAATRVAADSAGVETRAAGAATRDAGATAATRAAGATEGITTKAGEISSKLDSVSVPEGATPGSVPGGRAPVEAPVPQETPRVEPAPRAPDVPHSEPSVTAEPHTPAEPQLAPPHNGAPVVPEAPRAPEPVPHSAEAPSAHATEPAAPAATAPSVPHMEAPAPPSAPEIPSASEGFGSAQPATVPSQELASVGAETRGAESSVAAGDHAPGSVEHGSGAGESGSGHGGSGEGHRDGGGFDKEPHNDQPHQPDDDPTQTSDHEHHADTNGDASPQDHHGESDHPGNIDDSHSDTNGVPISKEQFDEIIATEKGERPEPGTYLPPEYIAEHLKSFDDGASRIVLRDAYEDYGIGKPDPGRTEYVLTSDSAREMIVDAAGDPVRLAERLGIPEDQLSGTSLVMIEFHPTDAYQPIMPSGNEWGTNTQWLPGGRLPHGDLEAVVNTEGLVKGIDYTVIDIITGEVL
ncbi:hypothetical protein [Mycobacterium sp. OAE908]|uniref:WXG100-like domain-containing protein n=1 Tax=Mycobacterium sp. OAE908 TaxID=2817899 RepID=UPI001AE73423